MVEGDRIRRVIEGKAQATGRSFVEVEKAALANVSMHSMVTARQLADQVLFLCSPRGRTISGQAISVCGDTLQLI